MFIKRLIAAEHLLACHCQVSEKNLSHQLIIHAKTIHMNLCTLLIISAKLTNKNEIVQNCNLSPKAMKHFYVNLIFVNQPEKLERILLFFCCWYVCATLRNQPLFPMWNDSGDMTWFQWFQVQCFCQTLKSWANLAICLLGKLSLWCVWDALEAHGVALVCWTLFSHHSKWMKH